MFLSKCEDNFLDDGMKINIRLHNYPESMIALKNLKAAYIGKFNFMYAFFFLPPDLDEEIYEWHIIW